MRTSEQRLAKVERAAGPPPKDWVILLPGDPDPGPDFKADYAIPEECFQEHAIAMRAAGLDEPSKYPLVTR